MECIQSKEQRKGIVVKVNEKTKNFWIHIHIYIYRERELGFND